MRKMGLNGSAMLFACAAREVLTAADSEVEDTSMARRPTEKARCDFGCRHPTPAHTDAQRRANMPNVTVKAGAPPLSPVPTCPVQDRQAGKGCRNNYKQLKHAEPSVLAATQDSRPGRCQASKLAPSSSARKPNEQLKSNRHRVR